MIHLENVSVYHEQGHGRASVAAVRELSLGVAQGETLCLIGPSGCGKTTSLRLINRMIEPDEGRVLVDGEDVANVEATELRRRIGYVIQSGGLFPHFSVRQNIGLLAELEGWEPDRLRARCDELLELVGLEPQEFCDRFPSELSGGQRQRVGVARALTLNPPIVLMDEPFGALDPMTRKRLQREFKDLIRKVKKTVVLVTHDVSEALYLGDRIAVMSEGKIQRIGTGSELQADPGCADAAGLMGQLDDAD